MKKVIIGIVLVIALIGGGAAYLYKSGKLKLTGQQKEALEAITKSSGTEWKYEKTITEPIKKVSNSNENVALGDLDQNAVKVEIPKGSFDADTEVELKNPDSVPKYLGNEVETIGAPIEISASSPTRLNEKATVTFKFDKSKLSPDTEKGQLRVMYYDGSKWDYIKPTKVDMESGLITFETFHFSFYGANKVKDENQITEQWIKSAAFDKELRDKLNDASDHVAGQMISMMLEKMGISDESMKGKVLTDLLSDDGYKDIHDALVSGDPEAGQKLAVFAGGKIAEVVPESIFAEGLKHVTGGAETIANVSKAAGYVAGGQYKDAARIIGEQIADEFLITTAGKIAAEVIQGQIDSWKNSEVEAAFKAYKDGADGKFWGYNVDKGDFDGVWTQMRGIGRQLELEAIAKENAIRAESGMPPLNEKQEDSVRAGVKESFRKQFELRSKNEDAIKKTEEDLRTMVDAFQKANFFSSALGPQGLDKGLGYEEKLDVLGHFMQKIMNDTGRHDLSTKNGLIMDDAIAIDDVVQGARIYFSGPNGKKDYAQFLKDRFNIDPFPKITDLAGSWKGTTVVTDIIISDAAKEEIAKLEKEGCDMSKLEEAKGKSNPLNFTLKPTSETGGDFVSNGKTTPFTYSDGVLTMSATENEATGVMTLAVSQDVSSYVASGSMNVDFKGGLIKIIMSVNASKGKQAKQAPKTK